MAKTIFHEEERLRCMQKLPHQASFAAKEHKKRKSFLSADYADYADGQRKPIGGGS